MGKKGNTITTSPNKLIEPNDLAEICAQAAESKKASDIIVLDVDGKVDIAQYFVICSASNDRLVKAITKAIEDNTHKFSIKAQSIEGNKEAQWILLDYSTVVVHVFLQDARDYYRIERLFKDSEKLSWRSLDSAVS